LDNFEIFLNFEMNLSHKYSHVTVQCAHDLIIRYDKRY